jgi:hypothetical protein
MQQRFDIGRAPQTPLRAERPQAAHATMQDNAGHIRGVDATPRGLIRSTVVAGAAALAVLTIFYLPAEYGVDATGLGGILGLTEMGQIKQQLYAEAAADDAAAGAGIVTMDPAVMERLQAIETQLTAISAVIGAPALVAAAPAPEPATAPPAPPPEVAPTPEVAPAPEVIAIEPAVEAAVAEATAAFPEWRDEVSYTLPPGEGVEVKLVMEEGQIARFFWTANGGVVNYDTHADGGGQNISYEQGRAVPEQTGELVAAFTGNHGWFWRNRSDAPVTLTLRTAGDYAEMKAP